MRICSFAIAILILAGCGCRAHKPQAAQGSPAQNTAFAPLPEGLAPSNPKLIVTPEEMLVGKVATVNPSLRFVVLSFPPGRVPAVDQRLNLYRGGLKVGEVKITGPQTDENTVADVVAGDSAVGDEVRTH